MPIPRLIEHTFFNISDTLMALWPRPVPSKEKLNACRVISHRGESDNKRIFENTFAAFDPLINSGVWAIEFDIRWTKDLVPVIFHDVGCKRVFGDPIKIKELTFNELHERFPQIPSLEAMLERYAKRIHLMIELKIEAWRNVKKQAAILEHLLSDLTPCEDYHIISLYPKRMFEPLHFVPAKALIPILIIHPQPHSQLALKSGYAGLLGHYAFLSNATLARHHAQQQVIGVGFIESRNSLFRELNRGVDWIYTSHALKIQNIINQLEK